VNGYNWVSGVPALLIALMSAPAGCWLSYVDPHVWSGMLC